MYTVCIFTLRVGAGSLGHPNFYLAIVPEITLLGTLDPWQYCTCLKHVRWIGQSPYNNPRHIGCMLDENLIGFFKPLVSNT